MADFAALSLDGFRAGGDRAVLQQGIDAAWAAFRNAEPGSPVRARSAVSLGGLLRERFWTTDDRSYLGEAIGVGRAAVEGAAGHVERTACQADLCESIRALGFDTDSVGLLDEAVRLARAALDATAEEDSQRAARLHGLGFALWSRSLTTPSALDAADAVRAGRAALSAAEPSAPLLPAIRFQLARSLLHAHQLTGDPQDLGEAMRLGRAAVESLSPTHVDFSNYQDWYRRVLSAANALRPDSALSAQAVAAGRAAVDAAALDDPYRRGYISGLMEAVEEGVEFAERRGDRAQSVAEAAAQAATAGRARLAALAAGSPEDSGLGLAIVRRLGGKLAVLFAAARTETQRHDAVSAQRAATEALHGAPWYAWLLDDLSLLIRCLNLAHPDARFAVAAAQGRRAAAGATLGDDPQFAARHFQLALDLWRLHGESHEPHHLREAVEAGRIALAATAADERVYGTYAANLASDLVALHLAAGDGDMLSSGIEAARAALNATVTEDPNLADRRHNLASFLLVRYERTGDSPSLAEAQMLLESLLSTSGANFAGLGPDRAGMLGQLANVKIRRYERGGDPRLLDGAIELGRAAIDVARDASDAAMFRGDLAMSLMRRFESTGDLESLREAVAQGRAALVASVNADVLIAVRANLASALVRLYDRTGEVAALHEAVELARAAAGAAGPSSLFYVTALVALGLSVFELGTRTGDVQMLRESVAANRRAAAAIPASHPYYALILTNLGAGCRALYNYSGDVTDLRDAVAAGRASLADTSGEGPHVSLRLLSLALSLLTLAERTGSTPTVREAVAMARAAVASTTAGNFMRPATLHALGSALHTLYMHTGDQAVAREAVAIRRAAVADLPPGHAVTASLLSAYARTLDHHYGRTRDPAVLRELVTVARRGLENLDEDRAERTTLRSVLASARLYAFEDLGDTHALQEARELYQLVAQDPVEVISTRLRSWAARSKADIDAGDARSALVAAEAAVALLPQSAGRELGRGDREMRLANAGGIAGRVAAAALAAGDPVRAVELLEQARGLLLGEAMGMRAARAALNAAAPKLAAQFDLLRDAFARLEGESVPDAAQIPRLSVTGVPDQPRLLESEADAAQSRGRERRETSGRWAALMAEIRAQPGFSDFLMPAPIARLQADAGCAPVVLLTEADARGEALILTADRADPVRAVPLSDLTHDHLLAQVDRFRLAVRTAQSELSSLDAQRRAQSTILEVLAWLWDAVAAPVLSALGHDEPPRGAKPWPRVWWCPTGALSLLPLHAAGHHRDLAAGVSEPRTVLDRVVSSYTATVRVLGYAATPLPAPAAQGKTLIVVPHAQHTSTLDHAQAEARDLAALLPGATVLAGAEATSANVRAALPGHNAVHFACHAISDWSAPRNSRLLLADHREHRLDLSAISGLELDAGLAFLSACETTDVSPRLVDEALHITSAFQLAGYRHVIGTLWPVNDAAAHRIAREVYTQLTAGGTRSPDLDGCALALHESVRRMREENRGALTPTRWAAHIHTGP